jgi:hypothetical protein
MSTNLIIPTEYHVSRFSSVMVIKDNAKDIAYQVYNKVSGLMLCSDADHVEPINFKSYNAAKEQALFLRNHYLALGG